MNQTAGAEPVYIVGGGPVGMITALELESYGIQATILESGADELRSEWRGSTLHPPTIEILDGLGLSADILNEGVRLERLCYRDLELEGEASFEYNLLAGLTRFPFRVQFEQYKLIRLLKRALNERRVETRYGCAVVGLHQDDDGVELEVESGSARDTIRSRWAIGADGAHSTVRKAVQVSFPGFTYPFQSLVVATRFPFDVYLPDVSPVTYWTGPRGRFSLIRTPDIWRIALTTDTRSGEAFVRQGSQPHSHFISDVELLFRGKVDPLEMKLEQHQMYRTHQRLAATFRCKNVLLAGDAAHLSSTTGGMGLNSGIHDAHALANAFGQHDRESSLTAYADGRRRMAEEIIQPLTTSSRQGTDLSSVAARADRLANLVNLASDPSKAQQYLVRASMLDVAGLAAGPERLA